MADAPVGPMDVAEEVDPRKGEDNYQLLFSNQKRTYDEYQDNSLERAKSNNRQADALNASIVQMIQIGNQALQNAVETANMIGKQAVAHRDIAINAEWNLEPSQAAGESAVLKAGQLDNASLAAINAAVAAAIATALSALKEKI